MFHRALFHHLGWVTLFWLALTSQATAGNIFGDWFCISNQESEETQSKMHGTFSFGINGFLNGDMNITFVSEGVTVEANAKYLSSWELVGNKLSDTPIRVWISKYDINGFFARNSVGADELQWSLMKDSDIPAIVTFNSDNEMLLDHKGRITHCERKIGNAAGS